MKKIFLTLATVVTLFACNKKSIDEITDEPQDAPTMRKCSSNEVLENQMSKNPLLRKKMNDIEMFTQDVITNSDKLRKLANGTIEIPVVVNVLYRTTAENISLAQIQSQIDALNKDYAATNADYTKVPSTFTAVRAGNCGITFVLDQVIRKSTTVTGWTTNDAVKKTTSGGLNPTSPSTKLNLWVCTLSGGVLGYAQFPGGASATDGVVILNTAFGTTGTAKAPFNRGRTATHEVGHWLNLRHIWGDANCGSDLVGDTPPHNTANYGCPAAGHKSTCTGTPIEMTMNYMDYTDDACMYMFSAGQKARMLATFAVGGPRNSFAQP